MKANGGLPTLAASTVRTAHRDVTDRLREAIVSGLLPAGTHLVQADLAAQLQVSVTPIREALRDLESQGLVDVDPFRGATVHKVSLAELEEVYALRRLLVPMAIRERVQTITDEELDEAGILVRRMTLTSPDAEWVENNRRLHRLLDGTSNQPHLRAILRRLADVSALYVGLSVHNDPARRRRARDDHRAMVKAYRARDADAVIAITLNHINDTATVAAHALQEDAD
ncbi:GntR family transcriptional regulator [Cryptosporangium phraense]|uniref:GntR family transcriptional regulator n=1 Tax=Cryptosporangium phraense TaxID=2593070 RepID=A0A545APC1_9ACTN|nr:GntR family transcriptional regulator [Cryptosporangium phraense]TQS43174.1 GntR family transcriptional regulator [Cryptosporangium phraense]